MSGQGDDIMEVKVHFHGINSWVSSQDTYETFENIGGQLIARNKPKCEVRNDGKGTIYDFLSGQPRLKIKLENGLLTVTVEKDNALIKNVYVENMLVLSDMKNAEGKSVVMPISFQASASEPLMNNPGQIITRVIIPAKKGERKDLKIGMIVSIDDRCGIAQHTKYFLDELKCNYKLYSPNDPTLFDNIMKDNVTITHIQHEFQFFDNDRLITLVKNLKNEGVKTVLDMHSAITTPFTVTIGKLVDKIIVHNPLAKENSVYNQKTIMVPLATPTPENLDKQQSRIKYDVDGNPVIASFGFINRKKGLTETLNAIIQLQNEFPKICFLLVGSLHPKNQDYDYLNHLHNHAKDLGINVVWKEGFYPIGIVHQLLSCADLNVLFYKNVPILSGSGPARICLASHRPLIVSDIPTFAEFQDAVIRVPEGNVPDLADAIRQLLSSEEHQKILIEKGNSFLKGISGEFVARRFEEIYREIET